MFGLFPMLEPETALVPEWDSPGGAKALDAATAAQLGNSLGGATGGFFNLAGELLFGGRRADQQQQLWGQQLDAQMMAAQAERDARAQRTAMVLKVVAAIAVLAFLAFILYLILR
ncbi:MAG: hypothetical protein QY325_04355 [Flavobacteriales bacterium]|nr:MAG: hypothetical protein QY325_04355 [Flavobacteriales bacterium]